MRFRDVENIICNFCYHVGQDVSHVAVFDPLVGDFHELVPKISER
jgi:hypothetical protein